MCLASTKHSNVPLRRCIIEKQLLKPAKCSKWEPYSEAKAGFKLSGKQGEHAIHAYFRNGRGDAPWGPASARVTFDNVAPKQPGAKMALKATYAVGNYTLSFANGAEDTVSRVDAKGYIVAHDTKTPKAKCASGTLMTVAYDAKGRGSVSVAVPEAELTKHKFKICAKVCAVGGGQTGPQGGTCIEHEPWNGSHGAVRVHTAGLVKPTATSAIWRAHPTHCHTFIQDLAGNVAAGTAHTAKKPKA